MQTEISIALNFLIAFLYNKLPRRRVNMLGEQMHKYLRVKFQDHWYPERPTQGSGYRSIRIGKDKIDKVLINAANDVSLDLQEILDSLPNDLTIWIDPGEVSYRIGEKGSIQVLYGNHRHLLRYDELSSDTDEVSNQEPIDYNVQIRESLDTLLKLSDSDASAWLNPVATPVLSIQTFAQTRFGSLKVKHNVPKQQVKILSNEFSACIKSKQQRRVF
ncbi:unnamed protein product [Rotaria socialis]|uniref:Anti-proliferative protein domain-containing protein n=1 Tax=Rotaria socialis TaxID=392032 RepID=A0A817Z4C6_9BILA|nr:unnamed protein product [Rotaria socialis]CAF3418937.1 unnamed protein product [Rotaria socialis]CAF3505898.1 unnamed protein product [Rotaria socialis]CAF3738285.1 unnamed protein product [Rotaria socialis]CAF3753217.1 unnamed protein product [Rotaria socialis]